MALIVRLNPWLSGRLIRRHCEKGDRKFLAFNEEETVSSFSSFFNHVDDSVTASRLDDVDSLRELNPALTELLDPYLVPHTKALINVLPAPALFKVTLLKMRADRFMLVMSISHVISDGSTYYALYGMLSQGSRPFAQPRSLRVERIRKLKPSLDAIMGGNGKLTESLDWVTSPDSLLRIVSLVYCRTAAAALHERRLECMDCAEEKGSCSRRYLCRQECGVCINERLHHGLQELDPSGGIKWCSWL